MRQRPHHYHDHRDGAEVFGVVFGVAILLAAVCLVVWLVVDAYR